MNKKKLITRKCTVKRRRQRQRLDAITTYMQILTHDQRTMEKRLDVLEALERNRSHAENALTQDERIREENRKGRLT